MKYLTQEDLKALIIERFIDESSQEDTSIVDTIESQNIELIKGMLRSKYDVDAIFDEDAPIKNVILQRILSKLTICDVIRRNAPRKIPQVFIDEYDKAMALLEKIATGRMPLDGVPTPAPGSASSSKTLWGNNSNKDFYI